MSDPSEQVAVWCVGEDWCPITTTASLIGKKWHPVIIHRLIDCEKSLVDRTIVSEKPFRVEYSLTELGESLGPVIDAMSEWGQEHLQPPEDVTAES